MRRWRLRWSGPAMLLHMMTTCALQCFVVPDACMSNGADHRAQSTCDDSAYEETTVAIPIVGRFSDGPHHPEMLESNTVPPPRWQIPPACVLAYCCCCARPTSYTNTSTTPVTIIDTHTTSSFVRSAAVGPGPSRGRITQFVILTIIESFTRDRSRDVRLS